MSKTNTEIVREQIEEVINHKHIDRIFDYYSRDCIIHNPPYVGLGLNFDDRSGEYLILTEIASSGPAAGKLRLKDKIVRVKDDVKTWGTFQDLKNGLWGQGVLGTPLTVTVNRDGKLIEIPLERGRVEGFDLNLSTNIEIWNDFTLKIWPDLKVEIRVICGEGDLVACYLVNSGTNQEYHHSAVWDECDIYRLKDGKIIEVWGVESLLVQMKQLGYQILPPVV
jgi:predicted SnoaL-like aldol condensation-catalyzing enzyme